MSSITGENGPVGGHATRNARNLLLSSALYMAEERFGRSIKLGKQRRHYSVLRNPSNNNQIYLLEKYSVQTTKQHEIDANRTSGD